MDEKQNENNLYRGKCTACGTWSTALVKDDGRCIACIEDDKFYEQQRKIKNNEIRD